MNKTQINSIKRVIEGSRNAILNWGWYMPSDPQTAALKSLLAKSADRLGKRDYVRFSSYLALVDNANRNMVYDVCANEKQLAAIEKALVILGENC